MHKGGYSENELRVARNLAGRRARKVTDDVASRVAVGGNTPRAGYLLGRGDGYAVSVDTIHRAQMAFVEEMGVATACGGESHMTVWSEQSGPTWDLLPIRRTDTNIH